MQPCWDKVSRAVFLKTRAEKIAKQARKSQRPPAGGSGGSAESAGSLRSSGPVESEQHDSSVYEPLCAFLRAANVYGGGFFLTSGARVPNFVRQYAERKAREEEQDDAPLA